MKKLLRDRYCGFTVTEIVRKGEVYGFEIQLICKDGGKIQFSSPPCKSVEEAEYSRENHIKTFANHSYIIDSDMRVKEFFEAWQQEIAKARASQAVYCAYEAAVEYIVERYGRLILSRMSEAHVVSIFKGAAKCPTIEVEFVKEVLKKALKYAKRIGYIPYNPAKEEQLFSPWFIADDRLSGLEEIETSEEGWPIWDYGEMMDEYIKGVGIELLEDT